MPSWTANWFERHRHPVSFWLHVIGIPLTLAAVVLAIMQLWAGHSSTWWIPLGLLVTGYVLQWIGHRVEGNDMGEGIVVKKWLRRPYLAVSPRYSRLCDPDRLATTHRSDGRE